MRKNPVLSQDVRQNDQRRFAWFRHPHIRYRLNKNGDGRGFVCTHARTHLHGVDRTVGEIPHLIGRRVSVLESSVERDPSREVPVVSDGKGPLEGPDSCIIRVKRKKKTIKGKWTQTGTLGVL